MSPERTRMHLTPSRRRLLLIVLVIVAVIAGFALYSRVIRPYLTPITLAYYQYRGPDPCHEEYCNKWARLNHTVVVHKNQIDSFLTITALEDAWPNPDNVTINISFDGGRDLVVIGGSTHWTGALHKGDSVTVLTSAMLSHDGTYFLWANPFSHDPKTGSGLGLVSVYQFQVNSGIVTGVSNASFENPGTPLERRCLSNCWP